jgi:hypothetical protein
VPTWVPFRLQFYFNGHAWLAKELRRAGIPFRMEDNALVAIADWNKAQVLADAFFILPVYTSAHIKIGIPKRFNFTTRACGAAA